MNQDSQTECTFGFKQDIKKVNMASQIKSLTFWRQMENSKSRYKE